MMKAATGLVLGLATLAAERVLTMAAAVLAVMVAAGGNENLLLREKEAAPEQVEIEVNLAVVRYLFQFFIIYKNT
jgi:hypothetical protein